MRERRPFQFSLATLMLAVTAYAVLFGIFRAVRLTNFAFVAATLYFTTVVYSQWALFYGRGPYEAAALTSAGLFELAIFVGWSDRNWLSSVFLGFVAGAFAGLGVAAVTDLAMMLGNRTRGVRRKPWDPEAPLFVPPSTAALLEEGRLTRGSAWGCWPRWRGCSS